MPTKILRPGSVGDRNEIPNYDGALSLLAAISDGSDDSFGWSNLTVAGCLWYLTDHGLEAGTMINSVTQYHRGRLRYGDGFAPIYLRDGDVAETEGTLRTDADFAEYNAEIPAPDGGWDLDGLANLQIGSVLYTDGDPGNYADDADDWVVVDYAPPAGPPTGSFSASTHGKVLSVDASGVTPTEGYTITGYAWDWGDGSPAGSGETAEHTYAAYDTYTVTLTVTYDSLDTFDVVDDVEVSAPAAPSGTFSTSLDGFFLLVNAAGVSAPLGYSISSYAWAWGDSTPAGSGVSATHRYAAGGSYTVTLTVTYDSGDSYEITEEVSMPTITAVAPLRVTRGAAGTLITITGTGFGASQGYGTVEIGGVEAIIASWADTSITCRADDSPATPLGAQHVVVTENGGTDATARYAVYVYDATDEENADEVVFGMVKEVYFDGLHVGMTGEDGLTFITRRIEKMFTPDSSMVPAKRAVYITEMEVSLALGQVSVDGATLAKLIGGTWDATNKILNVEAGASQSEISLMVVEESGGVHVWPRMMIGGDTSVALNKEFVRWPVAMKTAAVKAQDMYRYDAVGIT